MLHTGMLKGFMDGSLGSHTAAMLEPYADDPKNSGLPRYEAAKLNEMTKERVLAGFQIGFHAIGDKGVQMALDAFAEAEKAAREAQVKAPNGGEDFRLRIEHAQVTTPAQIAQFKTLESDCFDAAQSFADRHALGAGSAGTEARGDFLCMAGLSE